MNLLLLASGFLAQYRVLRCAAALGGEVTVLGSGGARSLAISRYCRRFQPFSFEADDMAGAAEIDAVARAHGIGMILPSDGPTTRYLARIRHLLSTPVFPVPDLAAFDALATKDRFMSLCRRLGIPHPHGAVFADREHVADSIRERHVQLPAIVKPLNRAGSIGVKRIDRNNAFDVVGAIDFAPVLVQDFVEGVDRSMTIFCRDGAISKQVIYSHPGGVFRFEDEPALARIVSGLAASLNLTGVFNFDARIDADGQVWMIECNPRFFFNMDVAMIAGVNFAELDETAPLAPLPVPQCEIRVPHALPRDLLRMRIPEKNDWSMLKHWLRDPVIFLLAALRYQRVWHSTWIEKALSLGKSAA